MTTSERPRQFCSQNNTEACRQNRPLEAVEKTGRSLAAEPGPMEQSPRRIQNRFSILASEASLQQLNPPSPKTKNDPLAFPFPILNNWMEDAPLETFRWMPRSCLETSRG